jgi:hypothetical protein
MRKVGNPQFGSGKKYTIVPGGDEPLNRHLQLKIPASMAEQLETVGDKNEFVRQAIANALKSREA